MRGNVETNSVMAVASELAAAKTVVEMNRVLSGI